MRLKILTLVILCGLLLFLDSCMTKYITNDFIQVNSMNSKWFMFKKGDRIWQEYYFIDSLDKIKPNEVNEYPSLHFDWDDNGWPNNPNRTDTVNHQPTELNLYFGSHFAPNKYIFTYSFSKIKFIVNGNSPLLPADSISSSLQSKIELYYCFKVMNDADTINTLTILFDSVKVNNRMWYIEPLKLKKIKSSYYNSAMWK